MDRFDAMQVLLAVVGAGSLSAGSRKLNAPLPSVSRKVAALERHLGTRLFFRISSAWSVGGLKDRKADPLAAKATRSGVQ